MNNPTAGAATGLLHVRVSHREVQAQEVVALTLVPAEGQGPLPAFDAGAHIDLLLPNGLVRQYSLCNAPHERDHYLIAVLREPSGRGGSACVHEALRVGTALQIGLPRNAFALLPCPHTLLLAGGIGLTPLLAMAEQLWAEQRSFELHACARSVTRLPFRQRLKEAPWAHLVHLHHDDGPPSQHFDARALLGQSPPGTQAWVCGPSGFIGHVREQAQALGWAADRVHVEHFAAPPGAAGPVVADAAAFTVEWQPTGQRIPVAPGTSVAQALGAAGIALQLSCEQGICGSCTVRVISGEPDHRDQFYTPDEHANQGHFTPCCSRSRSPLLVLANH
ncbi:PDR/VanB family oxidoreductase [Hydrogenophaga palleronii]|uniref:PDR/VanB family oxidoreductase n=1 Tax=Hydrogenophaga palleronii TaxID=65655 RepID=UPI00082434A6|nr:PDR/VanB family oxidoreductase [Hydrogenophaga palleronii]